MQRRRWGATKQGRPKIVSIPPEARREEWKILSLPALRRNQHCQHVHLALPLEMGDNKFLLFKPLSL